MPADNSPAEAFVNELVLPILTGEWISWEVGPATDFSNKVRKFVELASMLRQRHDEQIDNAHNVGKFPKLERIRKARSSDDGPKEDPLAVALKGFVK